MSDNENGIKVRILDKEFRISCPEESEQALYNAASYLDKQMRRLRHSGRIIGLERIAVMAALNISHELLELRAKAPEEDEVQHLRNRLQALQQKIDDAISDKQEDCDKMNHRDLELEALSLED